MKKHNHKKLESFLGIKSEMGDKMDFPVGFKGLPNSAKIVGAALGLPVNGLGPSHRKLLHDPAQISGLLVVSGILGSDDIFSDLEAAVVHITSDMISSSIKRKIPFLKEVL